MTIKLNTSVTAINRDGAGARLSYRDTNTGQNGAQQCDILVLSGNIADFVRPNPSTGVAPILQPPTPAEVDLFGTKQPMQFLLSLVEFEHPPPAFKTLEYWPSHYDVPGGVIVRRDIGHAEHGTEHSIGGLQSMSIEPTTNRSVHWASQQAWMAAQGVEARAVLLQAWYPNYLEHYTVEDIMERKPWRVDGIQMLDGIQTLYVGGSASFETVEDSFQYNLKLVHDIFDSAEIADADADGAKEEARNKKAATAASPPNAATPAFEQLIFTIDCNEIDKFIAADAATWTPFLSNQSGFVAKMVTLDPSEQQLGTTTDATNAANAAASMCHIRAMITWASRRQWKAIPTTELVAVSHKFQAAFGSNPTPVPFPTIAGLDRVMTVDARTSTSEPTPDQRLNHRQLASSSSSSSSSTLPAPSAPSAPLPAPPATTATPLPSLPSSVDGVLGSLEASSFRMVCADLDRFVQADNSTWTAFLKKQLGFVSKSTFIDPAPSGGGGGSGGANCTVWTITRWLTRELWKSIDPAGLEATAEAFAKAMAPFPAPMPQRYPTAAGLDVAVDTPTVNASGTRVPAIAGNDVVAYFSLKAGEMDVPGLPQYRHVLESQNLLPAKLQHLHPEGYEFWFSTQANLALFVANPWKYIPMFGGHCTHGIASRNDLTPETLADGRVAFTCVNTTQWAVVNGSLYMNSCGMYDDFVKDPAGDIAKASKAWLGWFGSTRGAGPLNDACFQDGGKFKAPNWVGHLMPPECVIN